MMADATGNRTHEDQKKKLVLDGCNRVLVETYFVRC